MDKMWSTLSVLLFSFVISYLLASAFNKYGLEVNSIITSIIIVISAVTIVEMIIKLTPSKPKLN
ncbi:hypothetical protein JFL43_05070 [Viridibacillus sp. YIM B01967]|uniref:DeoR faimly transcriptional regulator n=1 Tax=Viridibacillus soli TaxID=2798301 RepID=A0ABS1H4A7_9BACL|nr:hypothetical protein [Viridibacillus soli]MBK3494236.1 hypothetical protein [Viridibacillus soli]